MKRFELGIMYGFEQVPEAHQRMADNRHKGKMGILIQASSAEQRRAA